MGTPITLSEVGRCFVFITQLNVDLEELLEEIRFFEFLINTPPFFLSILDTFKAFF